jgi:flagellar motor switch/type III secretory pathway protein FliN
MATQAQPLASSPAERVSDPAAMERFDWLPCRLTLQIPVSEFTVGDLLRLQKGSVVATAVRSTEEIPLSVNGQLIAWIQFEMLSGRLAARITEFA